jgi:hypothetical protein
MISLEFDNSNLGVFLSVSQDRKSLFIF